MTTMLKVPKETMKILLKVPTLMSLAEVSLSSKAMPKSYIP